MKTLWVLFFVVIFFNRASGQNDNPYNFTRKSLPGLSELENMAECLENPDGVFYSVDIDLLQDDTPLSQFMQTYAMVKTLHYNYSHLHRAICGTRCGLNRTHTIFNETVVSTLKKCLNDSFYNEYGLQVDSISIFYVKTNEKVPTTIYEKTVAALCIFFVLLNIGVSLYCYVFPSASNEGKSLITAFSIQKNWEELSHGGRGEGNLFKCIEALRFYTNVITLALHTAVFLSSGLIQNADYVEDAFAGFKKMYANLRIVMQTFFVIGGFLMANKIFVMIENKKFSMKSIPMLSINRYLRIMPTLMTMVALTATWIPKMGSGALWERVVTHEGLMCKKNWWHVASLWQNFFPFEDECLPQSWYLGADWQLFHVSLLIILIAWKLPKHGTAIMVGTSFISILIVFLQSYILDLRPIRASISPDLIRTRFKGDDTIFYGYFSPQCNWSGYHIGVLTAYLYRKSQSSNWDLQNSRLLKTLYTLSGPIIIACVFMGSDLHHRKASTFEAAIFNSLNQNLYAAAIGIIILGTLFRMNSIYQSVLEWDPLQAFGRLSYCSLLIHTGILRTYGGHQLGFYASDYNFLMLFVGVFCMTYALAVPLYIFVEAPAYALQRMLLPSKKEIVKETSLSTEKVSESKGIKPNEVTLSNEQLTNEVKKISSGIDGTIYDIGNNVQVSNGAIVVPNEVVKLSNGIGTLTNGEDILSNGISLPNGNRQSNGSVRKMARRIDSKKVNSDNMTK